MSLFERVMFSIVFGLFAYLLTIQIFVFFLELDPDLIPILVGSITIAIAMIVFHRKSKSNS